MTRDYIVNTPVWMLASGIYYYFYSAGRCF